MIFDVFKKSAITTSADLERALGAGWSTPAGVSVTPKQAAKFAPVFSCIRVLAESIGMLPWHLYETVGKNRQRAPSHPLHDLLYSGPTSYLTSQEWREMIVAHLCLRGNHYGWINRVGNTIREILPLNPDAVKPKLSNDWELTYTVTFPDGKSEVLPASDIYHIRLMSMDGINGLNPIEQARASIGLGIAAETFGSRLFKNNTRPGGVLSTDKKLDKEQVGIIRDNWEEVQGGENSMRTAILQGGLQWTSVAINPEDAQFLETRKYQRSEIAGLFRVPPHMIGDMEKATFSNIEQQSMDFVTQACMPLITRMEQRTQKSLLTREERKRYYSKINVAALLRGDMKARAEFYTKLVQNGAMSPNEIRELEDMNPRENGDIWLTPSNMNINGKPAGATNDD